MNEPGQSPAESDAHRRAERIYAEFLEREDGPDPESFEKLLASHPEHADALRRIHSGMGKVETAIEADGTPSSLHLGYELLEELGSGGHGKVFRARDRALDCDVAVKTFDDDGTSDQRERFMNEARAMAKIRHPNVVRIHAVDAVEHSIRLILEYVDGRTFEELVESSGPLSAREAAQVGVELCAALGALHAAELVHMDVKPGNVMRERGGRTVLLDFSLVRSPDPEDARLGGTPPFMAPEHFGHGTPGPWTDVYGLGATLYRLVCGRYPLESDSIGELRERIIAGRVTPLLDVQPDMPRDFAAIVEKAMSPAPADRFASMGHFDRALRDYLAGSAPVERPSRRGLWLLGGALAASLTALTLLWPREQAPAGPRVEARLFIHPADAVEGQEADDASRVRVGDGISVVVEGEEPFYAYLFNEDEAGLSYTLYPRDESAPIVPGEPFPLGRWQVDSPGGVEHLYLITSRQPSPFGETLRRKVQLAKAGFQVSQLGAAERGELRSLTRGIGVQLEEAPSSAERGESLASFFSDFEAFTRTDRAGESVRHWALPHAD